MGETQESKEQRSVGSEVTPESRLQERKIRLDVAAPRTATLNETFELVIAVHG